MIADIGIVHSVGKATVRNAAAEILPCVGRWNSNSCQSRSQKQSGQSELEAANAHSVVACLHFESKESSRLINNHIVDKLLSLSFHKSSLMPEEDLLMSLYF